MHDGPTVSPNIIHEMAKRPHNQGGDVVTKRQKGNIDANEEPSWFAPLFSELRNAMVCSKRMVEYINRNACALKNMGALAASCNPNQILQLAWLMVQMDRMEYFLPLWNGPIELYEHPSACERQILTAFRHNDYYRNDPMDGPSHNLANMSWKGLMPIMKGFTRDNIVALITLLLGPAIEKWFLIHPPSPEQEQQPKRPHFPWTTVHPRMLLWHALERHEFTLFRYIMALPGMFDVNFDWHTSERMQTPLLMPPMHHLVKYVTLDPHFPNQLCLYFIHGALIGGVHPTYGVNIHFRFLQEMMDQYSDKWSPNVSIGDTLVTCDPSTLGSVDDSTVATQNETPRESTNLKAPLDVWAFTDIHSAYESLIPTLGPIAEQPWRLPGFMFPIINLLSIQKFSHIQRIRNISHIEKVTVPLIELLLGHPKTCLSWDSNAFLRTLCLTAFKYFAHNQQLLGLVKSRRDVDPLCYLMQSYYIPSQFLKPSPLYFEKQAVQSYASHYRNLDGNWKPIALSAGISTNLTYWDSAWVTAAQTEDGLGKENQRLLLALPQMQRRRSSVVFMINLLSHMYTITTTMNVERDASNLFVACNMSFSYCNHNKRVK